MYKASTTSHNRFCVNAFSVLKAIPRPERTDFRNRTASRSLSVALPAEATPVPINYFFSQTLGWLPNQKYISPNFGEISQLNI
jgi:hypothetical protein